MNKKLTLLIILAPLMVNAEQIIIQPRIVDFNPHDGMFDAGTPVDPYEMRSADTGQVVGTVKTRIIDFNPNDGLFDAGTTTNPYVFEVDK